MADPRAEAGIINADATVTSTSPLADPVDLQAEEDELEDDAWGAEWWRVVAPGISFRLQAPGRAATTALLSRDLY